MFSVICPKHKFNTNSPKFLPFGELAQKMASNYMAFSYEFHFCI